MCITVEVDTKSISYIFLDALNPRKIKNKNSKKIACNPLSYLPIIGNYIKNINIFRKHFDQCFQQFWIMDLTGAH